MPEGPECRRFAESLAKTVSGRQLMSVEILSGRYDKKPPGGLSEMSHDFPIRIVGAGAHGKFIYWIMDNEYSVWSTLGMTGQWSSEPTDHARVKFALSDREVYFNDQRNFGTLKFVRGKFKLLEKLKSLGPDMLQQEVTDDLFINQFRNVNHLDITRALMDQSVIAGVGNYIKSDSLWLARISPHRTVESLTDEELANLNRGIQQVMKESYRTGGASFQTYKDFDGNSGEYTTKFLVYNQKVDPDGHEVVREMTADKRTTHWCPNVQK